MSESASNQPAGAGPATERRSNEVLRALVNEMLERVRELSRRTTAWSADERSRAEAELELIMARVRSTAAHPESGE